MGFLLLNTYNKHGKSGDLGDPGSQKILQIAEILNKKMSSEYIRAIREDEFRIRQGMRESCSDIWDSLLHFLGYSEENVQV